MNPLIEALDGAPREDWEGIYASDTQAISLDEISAAARSQQRVAPWLAIRVHAGPPGVPLPEPGPALERVLQGEATPADAYAVLFGEHQLPGNEVGLAVIQNCALCCLTAGAGLLVARLAASAALACVAAGDVERARMWFDLDDRHDMPFFESIRPLRGALLLDGVVESPSVRRAACARWSETVSVPAVPSLHPPERGPREARDLVRKRLEAEAPEAAEWIGRGLFLDSMARAESLETHAFVRGLRNAVLVGDTTPPSGDPPANFAEWILLAHFRDEQTAVRLGALAMIRAGQEPERWSVFVLVDIREEDLPMLRELLPESHRQAILELEGLLPRVPEHLQRPLVVAAGYMHPEVHWATRQLFEHREMLREFVVGPASWLAQTITWVETLSAEGKLGADADNGVAELLCRLSRDLSPPEDLEEDVLIRAATQARQAMASPDSALATVRSIEDASARLVGAVALTMDCPDTVVERAAEVAAEEILRLEAIRLMPMRERLLLELLARADLPVRRAWALIALANTRNILSAGDPAVHAANVVLLQKAGSLARRAGSHSLAVDAATIRAKMLAGGELLEHTGSEALATETVADLRGLLELPLVDDLRGAVLKALAAMARHGGPTEGEADLGEVVRLLQEAVGLLSHANERWDAQRELAHALSALGRVDEAISLLASALEDASGQLGRFDRAYLHADLGRVLQQKGRSSAAEDHFLEGLRLIGGERSGRAMFRLSYGWFLHANERNEEALDQLERIRAGGVLLPSRGDRRELERLHAAVLHGLGRSEDSRNASAAALDASHGTAWEPLVLIERARAAGHLDEVYSVLTRYFEGSWPVSTTSDNQIDKELDDLAGELPRQVVETAARWAEARGRHRIHARMLHALGEDEAAVTVLEQHIEGSDGRARVDARLLVLACLPVQDVDGRRAQLEALDREVDDYGDLPATALHDLAEFCRMATAGDQGWSTRALWFAQEALQMGRESSLRSAYQACWLRCLRDRVWLEAPKTSEDLARRVQGAVEAMFGLDGEAAGLFAEVADALLLTGPAVHPSVLDVVEKLLHQLPSTAASNARERFDAIRRWRAGEETRLPRSSMRGTNSDPFDALGATWVGGVLRSDEHGSDMLPVGEPTGVGLACKARPDLADELVCAAVGRVWVDATADGDLWRNVLAFMVQDGPQGEDAWTRTAARLEQPDIGVEYADLRRAVRRARHLVEVGDEVPVDLSDAFKTADEAMLQAQRTRDPEELLRLKRLAVDSLRFAVEGWRGSKHEVDALISLGNALRKEPEPDQNAAIENYVQALALEPRDDMTLGKLHKVWADALRELDTPDALREAWTHVHQALAHRRSGWLRAETLWAAAQVADEHPDWDHARRAAKASTLMVQAAECDAERARDMLPWTVARLATWRRLRPGDAYCSAALTRLAALYPDDSDVLALADKGLATGQFGTPVMAVRERDVFLRLYQLPDFLVAMEAEMAVGGFAGALEHFEDGELLEKLESRGSFRSELTSRSRPDALKKRLVGLGEQEGEAPLGVAAARAILTVALVRHGAVPVAVARTATEAALDALRASGADRDLRAHLLDRVASAWSPANDLADPVQDFALARDLRLVAVDIVGGEDSASPDLLLALGRSHRYAPSDDRTASLVEARRLYERGLEQRRAAGDANSIANVLVLLADLEGHLAHGDMVSRLRVSERRLREASEMATRRGLRAQILGNLAWTLTLLGERLPNDQAKEVLEEAMSLYQQARELGGPGLPSIDNNELICRQRLAILAGDPGAGIEAWRERVAQLREHGTDLLLAMAEHNLADSLIRWGGGEVVEEAVRLFQSALEVRRRAPDLRKRWESAFGLGQALSTQIAAGRSAGRTACRDALLEAANAARGLGGGEELARVGLALGRLAVISVDARVAEAAWETLQEVGPSLLVDSETASAISSFARWFAFKLSDQGAMSGIAGRVPGGAMLGPDASRDVLRWLLRADLPFHQRQQGRLRVPPAAPPSLRRAWLAALKEKDALAVAELLPRLRGIESDWLGAENDLEPTMRWLRERPASLAIAVWPGESGFLVVLLEPSGRATVMVLAGEVLPLEDGEAASAVRNDELRARFLEGVAGWARSQVVERVMRTLGSLPKRLLWVPHGLLRSVPPSRLFPGVEVAVSASLALRDPHVDRDRDRQGVVVVADPGSGKQALGEAALEGARRVAGALGDARLVVGVGDRHGQDVLAQAAPVCPSAEQVVRELDQAGIAVVLAHGHVAGPDDAWIDLLGTDGKPVRLSATELAERPRVLAGLTVVLLSCETGRAGGAADRPGGLAGALLLAGAVRIVAPLWPVSLSSALDVGEAIAAAWAERSSLEAALARVGRRTGGQGPQLGGRPSTARRAARAWDHAAFVTWVG